jgi:hypothetical protein
MLLRCSPRIQIEHLHRVMDFSGHEQMVSLRVHPEVIEVAGNIGQVCRCEQRERRRLRLRGLRRP